MKKDEGKDVVRRIDIEQIGKQAGDAIAETISLLAGAAATKPTEHIKVASTAIQEIFRGHDLAGIAAAIEYYKKNGRIKPDYQNTKQYREGIRILAQVTEKPFETAEDTIEAMKAVFLTMASEEISTRDETLPIALLDIANDLSKEELLVLSATYTIAKKHGEIIPGKGPNLASDWLESIANVTGWDVLELVELHEASLIQKRLITPRQLSDGSAVQLAPHYRLSPLGYKLCEFINKYEVPEKGKQ